MKSKINGRRGNRQRDSLPLYAELLDVAFIVDALDVDDDAELFAAGSARLCAAGQV